MQNENISRGDTVYISMNSSSSFVNLCIKMFFTGTRLTIKLPDGMSVSHYWLITLDLAPSDSFRIKSFTLLITDIHSYCMTAPSDVMLLLTSFIA